MSFKLVVDSCCELPESFLERYQVESIAFGLQIGDYYTEDDENFDQLDFIKRVADSEICAQSACPSPERFLTAYETSVDHIYVITIASPLSGCYNSANLGRDLYKEQGGTTPIHIIDSRSASCGQTQIAYKIAELEEAGESFEQICEKIEQYRDELCIYFVLNNLETLRKNGRMTAVKAVVASTLHIKPVMTATDEGIIEQVCNAIGINKALNKMVAIVVDRKKDLSEKRVMISHCNCLERAEYVRELFENQTAVKAIEIMAMKGLSTLYANDGGIIVTVE
ncbi:MAG: DegV family protein [Eubacteriales bacterium]